MKIKHLLKTPTMLVRPDRTAVRVGGPHCVRECGQTGQIWVALKGSVACHPAETPDNVPRSARRDSSTMAEALASTLRWVSAAAFAADSRSAICLTTLACSERIHSSSPDLSSREPRSMFARSSAARAAAS